MSAGIIPAYAGSTSDDPVGRELSRDHPRMRGEHAWAPSHVTRALGSSPHARGAPKQSKREPTLSGIIPARAGSTEGAGSVDAPRRDHPRMRGEHTTLAAQFPSPLGSSPHARGALRDRRNRRPPRGIIPACAGSTTPARRCTAGWRDHPRMRGEHVPVVVAAHAYHGSSPHARGAPPVYDGLVHEDGIIPACAGSTPE